MRRKSGYPRVLSQTGSENSRPWSIVLGLHVGRRLGDGFDHAEGQREQEEGFPVTGVVVRRAFLCGGCVFMSPYSSQGCIFWVQPACNGYVHYLWANEDSGASIVVDEVVESRFLYWQARAMRCISCRFRCFTRCIICLNNLFEPDSRVSLDARLILSRF